MLVMRDRARAEVVGGALVLLAWDLIVRDRWKRWLVVCWWYV